jgi:5-hydroxyisourate hydrolase-like protein (transthyretin family)
MALQLFQQLIVFHRNDPDKSALLAVDLERIEWVFQHSLFTGKETVYQRTLQSIIEQYPALTPAATAWYLLAQQEFNRAATYAPFGDTTGRYGYVKAKQLIEKALPLFKEPNMGSANMQNLLVQINAKQLRTQTEQVNVPNKPFRALVSFRNTDSLFGRIIRIDNNDSIRSNNNENYWKNLRRLPAFRTFTQALPANTDFQPHSTEIKIDGLPVGEYALLTSNGKAFSDTANKMSIQFFYVSNISYLRNKNDFFVLNRENGKPLADVKVTILRPQYNSRLRKYIYDTAATRTTNRNGYFRFETRNTNNNNFRYQFVTATDRLSMQENEYSYYENDEAPATESSSSDSRFESSNNRVFFFTDRSIYRPGQTVFFKGIAVTRDRITKLSRLILSKDSSLVYLKDVNGKVIDSMKFGLNEYGSFAGNFRLPQNVLTGNFSVETKKYNYSAGHFSVEEYKRPKFSVSFDKVKGSYRLNDTIVITGSAKAYAGNAIDGAKVSYNITRGTRYQPWFRRGPYRPVPSREIAHGEVITDAEGQFTIKFKALADDIVDRNGNPTFDFAIHADITDAGGETHGTDAHVTIGFSSLLLQVNASSVSNADSTHWIGIVTTNLSNEKEPATVHVKIYSLVPPARAVRKRYWERPDQFVMTEKEFTGYFPTDEYREETDFQTWTTGRQVIEGTVETKDTNLFTVAPHALEAGAYRVEAVTMDKYGVRSKTGDLHAVVRQQEQPIGCACISIQLYCKRHSRTGTDCKRYNRQCCGQPFRHQQNRKTQAEKKQPLRFFLPGCRTSHHPVHSR